MTVSSVIRIATSVRVLHSALCVFIGQQPDAHRLSGLQPLKQDLFKTIFAESSLGTIATMNGFDLEEEQAATVEEALAFLDACDCDELMNIESEDAGAVSDISLDSEHAWYPQFQVGPASTWTSRSDTTDHLNDDRTTGSSGDENSGVDEQKRAARPQRQVKHYKKTREANVKAVSKYRSRKRSEVLELRNQVKKLTARLTHLRKRNEVAMKRVTERTAEKKTEDGMKDASSSRQVSTTTSKSRDAAVLEAAKLRQSKLLNHKLKDILAKQGGVNRTLESLVQQQITEHVRCTLLSAVLLPCHLTTLSGAAY